MAGSEKPELMDGWTMDARIITVARSKNIFFPPDKTKLTEHSTIPVMNLWQANIMVYTETINQQK